MKIQLFDDEDLKRFEDTIAKALVRALRTVMKEGLISGYRPPAPEAFATSQAEPAPAPTPMSPPPTVTPPEPESPRLFGMRIGEPQSGHGYRQTHPIAEALRPPAALDPDDGEAEGRSKRRKMTEFCPSVNTKPHGYITTAEAYKLMDMPEDYAKTSLRQWIQAGAVKGAILCGAGWTPTKGLPGRLFVDKQMVIARDNLRKQNAAMMKENGVGRFAQAAE